MKSMDKIKNAQTAFDQGFNCCQAVLSALCESLGLERDTALRLATPFGGGLAERQLVCGAVNGALMAIGLATGQVQHSDYAAKEHCRQIANIFLSRFIKEHGSLMCRELLGHDFNTPEGREAIRAQDLYRVRCQRYIADAVEWVEELLQKVP